VPTPPSDADLITHERQLVELFERAEKPATEWRVGVEAEKFGVRKGTAEPLCYAGDFGVLAIFDWLVQHRGYTAEREVPDGPIISLRKGGVSLTLEPGAQFELSAPAVSSMGEVEALFAAHFAEIAPISRELGLVWLSIGFQPFARQDQLCWVPKQRYSIMREYLPKRGSGGLDMMRRTATVQGNFDFSDEADALAKLRLSLKLSPLLNAWVANSPYVEGEFSGKLSARGDVWLRMDPARSGLIPKLWSLQEPGYRDYVEWALDAPMFLLKRDGRIIDNSGQPFRDFLRNGFQDERATQQDWQLHVNSLFPEARLKSTLEVRALDSLKPSLSISVVALLVGLLYDSDAREGAQQLLAPVTAEAAQEAQLGLVTHGLEAPYGRYQGFALAAELLALAQAGLARRALQTGEDERRRLEPLAQLLSERTSPAARLVAELGAKPDPARLIELTDAEG